MQRTGVGMKIRPGQPLRSQEKSSRTPESIADGRFQVLLDGEMQDTTEKPHDFDPNQDIATHQHHLLLGDATRLLDEAIEQIETDNAPREQTIESLHELRKKLNDLGTSSGNVSTANIILAVEEERLKSW